MELRPAEDYTTTNNCSQGLDLRSSSRHDNELTTRVDGNRLSLNAAAKLPHADKMQYTAKWCEDHREFTQSSAAMTDQHEFTQSRAVKTEMEDRTLKNDKPSKRDKLIKRFTHPFTQGDKKRLDEMIGQIANRLTSATVTDVQHSDFVQGRLCCLFSSLNWSEILSVSVGPNLVVFILLMCYGCG